MLQIEPELLNAKDRIATLEGEYQNLRAKLAKAENELAETSNERKALSTYVYNSSENRSIQTPMKTSDQVALLEEALRAESQKVSLQLDVILQAFSLLWKR